MFRRLSTTTAFIGLGAQQRRTVVHSFKGPSIEAEIAKGGNMPHVIDCYADWCGPCMQFAPKFDQLSAANEGKVRFVKINVDEFEEVAAELGIRSVPTFLFFDGNGKLVSTVEGASEPRIVAALSSLAPKQ